MLTAQPGPRVRAQGLCRGRGSEAASLPGWEGQGTSSGRCPRAFAALGEAGPPRTESSPQVAILALLQGTALVPRPPGPPRALGGGSVEPLPGPGLGTPVSPPHRDGSPPAVTTSAPQHRDPAVSRGAWPAGLPRPAPLPPAHKPQPRKPRSGQKELGKGGCFPGTESGRLPFLALALNQAGRENGHPPGRGAGTVPGHLPPRVQLPEG